MTTISFSVLSKTNILSSSSITVSGILNRYLWVWTFTLRRHSKILILSILASVLVLYVYIPNTSMSSVIFYFKILVGFEFDLRNLLWLFDAFLSAGTRAKLLVLWQGGEASAEPRLVFFILEIPSLNRWNISTILCHFSFALFLFLITSISFYSSIFDFSFLENAWTDFVLLAPFLVKGCRMNFWSLPELANPEKVCPDEEGRLWFLT